MIQSIKHQCKGNEFGTGSGMMKSLPPKRRKKLRRQIHKKIRRKNKSELKKYTGINYKDNINATKSMS